MKNLNKIALFFLISGIGCGANVVNSTGNVEGCPAPPVGTITTQELKGAISGAVESSGSGNLDFKYEQDIKTLLSKNNLDTQINAYVICAAKKSGFSVEQAMWYLKLINFKSTNPNSDQLIAWDKANPVPKSEPSLQLTSLPTSSPITTPVTTALPTPTTATTTIPTSTPIATPTPAITATPKPSPTLTPKPSPTPTATPVPVITYNNIIDFSDTQGEKQWYYLFWDGSSYSELTWFNENSHWLPLNIPGVGIGKDGLHPPPEVERAITWAWESELDGNVNISGNLRKTAISGGDGIKGIFFQNNIKIYEKSILFDDNYGVNFNFNRKVKKGERLYFRVNNNEHNDSGYDSSFLEINIKYL